MAVNTAKAWLSVLEATYVALRPSLGSAEPGRRSLAGRKGRLPDGAEAAFEDDGAAARERAAGDRAVVLGERPLPRAPAG